MKILSITEFTTTPGVMQETVVPLDSRAGVYFEVVTDTFKTPKFSADNTIVPVIMLHQDRAICNVTMVIEENELTISQGYRQASHGYLIAYVANDWTDSAELKSVYIDALEVASVQLNNGTNVEVTPQLTASGVNLVSKDFTPTAGSYPASNITTTDGKQYIFPVTFNSHQASTDAVSYDYITANVPRVMTAYSKGN